MYNYVCYLKKKMSNDYLVKMLSDIFEYKETSISELLNGVGHYDLRFENRQLDDVSEFKTELNVYILDKRKILNLELYNNLLFGRKVAIYIKDEILINDESDDPYQWILVKEGEIFLVEEEYKDNEGINLISSNRLELAFEKALSLLPDRGYVENKSEDETDRPYFVIPANLWKDCVK